MADEVKEEEKPLTPKQRLEAYQPNGEFAGVSIISFKPYIKGKEGERSLDEEAVKARFVLTDDMLPYLYKELVHAHLLTSDEAAASESAGIEARKAVAAEEAKAAKKGKGK